MLKAVINAERGIVMFTAMIAILAISGFVAILPFLLLFQAYINRLDFSVSMKHNVGVHIFAFYNAAILGITGIPSVRNISIDFNINLIPFADLDINFIQYLQNAILFLPMGFLIPLLWSRHRKLKKVALSGFLISLAIELAQLLCYRATDIDDLIMNTLGTLLGYALFKSLECRIIEWFPPKVDEKEKVEEDVENFIEPPWIVKHEFSMCLLIFWFAIFFVQEPLSSFLLNQYA